MNYKKALTSLIMLSMLAVAAPTFAEETVNVCAGQYTTFDGSGVSSVAIADPNVADVLVMNGEVLIVGKRAGATQMFIWRYGQREDYSLLVNGVNVASAAMIQSCIGMDRVDVTVAGGKILLEGSVPNQYDKNRAAKIAGTFGEVIDMLEMDAPRQVRIECRVLSLNKTGSRNLGFYVGGTGSTPSSNGDFQLGQSQSNDIANQGNIFHWFGTYAEINAKLTAVVNKGDGKVLSQPYIITMSGDKANVHIGGQIPVTTTTSSTSNTTWKDYGIMLNIEPIVQNNGLIDTKVNTEVSELDKANANNEGTPAIATRSAQTHVMMKPGMTMAIGGLISSEQGKTINKIPLLGDIPILGNFFKFTSRSKEDREIVILLTPIMVDSDYMPVMSDEMRRIATLKDEAVLRGDLHAKLEPKK